MQNNSKLPEDTASKHETVVLALWHKFNSEFPTEEDCVEALYTKFADQTVKCSSCQSDITQRNYGARIGKCQVCQKKNWFTAGTFFHRIRRAKPWLAAIWLLERGITVSAGLLHRLADIATSTAWLILKKLHLVINTELQNAPQAVLEPSASFLPAICKRSSETPALSHPVSEQVAIERREGKPACTTASHASDLVASINFIREHFHGASRKYLQFFLAAYWCKTDRETWSRWSLLKACRRFRKISLEEIIAFSSPLLLKLSCRQESDYQ